MTGLTYYVFRKAKHIFKSCFGRGSRPERLQKEGRTVVFTKCYRLREILPFLSCRGGGGRELNGSFVGTLVGHLEICCEDDSLLFLL